MNYDIGLNDPSASYSHFVFPYGKGARARSRHPFDFLVCFKSCVQVGFAPQLVDDQVGMAGKKSHGG